jgi:hypothetical protein
MNFRGFASKIQASAAQAAAKLPTFDDMAAKDDYIHSEEFNVSGQKRPNKNNIRVQESSTAAAATTGVEESSSVSSWSLLDRPVSEVRAALPTPSQNPLVRPDDDSTPKRKTPQHDRIETTTSSLSSWGEKSTIRSQNSLPLLAVVTDTLEEEEPLAQSIVSSLDHEDDQESQTSDSERSNNGYTSDDEYDEDDPIMSMIRKPSSKVSKKKQARKIKSKATSAIQQAGNHSDDVGSSKKSSRRFLDDLDDRLSTPESRMEAGVIVGQSENSSPPPVTNRWGWVNSMATEKMGQMLGRPVLAAISRPTTTSSSAPLARKKPEVKAAPAHKEEDFLVASSMAVLADDELAQLAKMKQPSMMDQLCMLLHSIQENRQFVFIAFTMLLAAAVYFYTRHLSIEDDVT